MKLVIEISENMIDEISLITLRNNQGKTEYTHVCLEGDFYITILPEGHGRLIDADALYDQYRYADYDFDKTMEYAPTIIEADKTESEE